MWKQHKQGDMLGGAKRVHDVCATGDWREDTSLRGKIMRGRAAGCYLLTSCLNQLTTGAFRGSGNKTRVETVGLLNMKKSIINRKRTLGRMECLQIVLREELCIWSTICGQSLKKGAVVSQTHLHLESELRQKLIEWSWKSKFCVIWCWNGGTVKFGVIRRRI